MTNCNLRKKGFVMAYGPKGGGVHHGTGEGMGNSLLYTHRNQRENRKCRGLSTLEAPFPQQVHTT